MRMVFHSYATECEYDYLFVYNGSSYAAPLLASYNGDTLPEPLELPGSPVSRFPTNSSPSLYLFLASPQLSPRLFLHSPASCPPQILVLFYSDTNYVLSGFNITVEGRRCADYCQHGSCSEARCICQPQWKGTFCDEPMCPNNCRSVFHLLFFFLDSFFFPCFLAMVYRVLEAPSRFFFLSFGTPISAGPTQPTATRAPATRRRSAVAAIWAILAMTAVRGQPTIAGTQFLITMQF